MIIHLLEGKSRALRRQCFFVGCRGSELVGVTSPLLDVRQLSVDDLVSVRALLDDCVVLDLLRWDFGINTM